MSELLTLRQGTGGVINVEHDVDGVPISGIQAAKYQLFNRDGSAVLTLSLGNGISWNGGAIVITITAAMANQLNEFYTHECAAIDTNGRDLIVLEGPLQFKPRKVRN
ncbi:MAG: hypothetical protein U5L02_16640 [Rheinheimera sp.]|nr:hypothetical protein [Rheinheimera sp.]